MIACVTCAYTVGTALIAVGAVVGGFLINCLRCFFLKCRKKHKDNCSCKCHKGKKKK